MGNVSQYTVPFTDSAECPGCGEKLTFSATVAVKSASVRRSGTIGRQNVLTVDSSQEVVALTSTHNCDYEKPKS